jgi:hypothetical protein
VKSIPYDNSPPASLRYSTRDSMPEIMWKISTLGLQEKNHFNLAIYREGYELVTNCICSQNMEFQNKSDSVFPDLIHYSLRFSLYSKTDKAMTKRASVLQHPPNNTFPLLSRPISIIESVHLFASPSLGAGAL